MAGKLLFFLISVVCCGELFALKLSKNNDKLNNSLRLVQAVALARHNIRAPLLSSNVLEKMTPKKWPVWNETKSHLTKKGVYLEAKNAAFFKKFLLDEGLLSKECPDENDVLIYANSLQRTLETAKVFAKNAFADCNLTVHYKTESPDLVFLPVIQNISESLSSKMKSDMKKTIEELDLRQQYLELNRILAMNSSEKCAKESVCDLAEIKDNVIIEFGKEPTLTGRLDLSISIVDIFLMHYYNGSSLDSIAWGEIDDEKMKLLAELLKAGQKARFGSTSIATVVARPLLKYMANIFLKGKPRFTLLVGHDSTLTALMTALNFKNYELQKQFEKTPIGGKLFFMKYFDEISEKYLLQIAYFYESTEQIRYGNMSLENPPYRAVLEMDECKVDKDGFCPWKDFESVIKKWE